MTAGIWNENKDFIHVALLLNYADKQHSWESQHKQGQDTQTLFSTTNLEPEFPNMKVHVQLEWNLTACSEQVLGSEFYLGHAWIWSRSQFSLYFLDSGLSNTFISNKFC